MRVMWLVISCASLGCLPRVGGLIDSGSDEPVDAGPLPAHCSNGVQDEDETFSDCGGSSCDPCADGALCDAPSDCTSKVCERGLCKPPASVCKPVFAGCATFVDAPADGGVVTFPTGGNRFFPPCLRVKLGQTVTFTGTTDTFAFHPLTQACGPTVDQIGSSSGMTKSFTFTSALGVYGYYCQRHGTIAGDAMSGAIEVVR